jgi:cytochrome c553
MARSKSLRKFLGLVHAICLVLILWVSIFPGIATAGPRDIIDPGNIGEANRERREVREDRVRQNVEREVRDARGSFNAHLQRGAGDFAKGLLSGLPPGSLAVSNAVMEVAKGCTTCHQPELVAKIRDRLNKLGTTGQAERDKQKALQRLRDWEARNPPSRPAPSTSPSTPFRGRNGGE